MIDIINIRGEYQENDENGSPVNYSIGDVVTFNQKTYIAYEPVIGHPYIEGNGWYQIDSGAALFNQIDPPKFVKSGDKWFDSDTGILYTMLVQENGYIHWVEL